MIQFLTDHIAEIANVMAILIPIFALMTWSHRRLRAETKEIREDMKAMNIRIDAMGNRIDHLYQVMMGMLQKKG